MCGAGAGRGSVQRGAAAGHASSAGARGAPHRTLAHTRLYQLNR